MTLRGPASVPRPAAWAHAAFPDLLPSSQLEAMQQDQPAQGPTGFICSVAPFPLVERGGATR